MFVALMCAYPVCMAVAVLLAVSSVWFCFSTFRDDGRWKWIGCGLCGLLAALLLLSSALGQWADVFLTDSMHLADLLWLLAFGCILSLVSADCFRRLGRRRFAVAALVLAVVCFVALVCALVLYLL